MRAPIKFGLLLALSIIAAPRMRAQVTTATDTASRAAPPKQRGDRNRITKADLDEAPIGNTTVYDVIQRMRPQWLVPRPGRVMSSDLGGSGGNASEIIVYIDDVRQPSMDYIRSMKANGLVELRFLEQNRAIQRYGPGHELGAIEITTVDKKR